MLSAMWITYNFQLCDLSNGRSRWRYEVERPRSGLSEANFLVVFYFNYVMRQVVNTICQSL